MPINNEQERRAAGAHIAMTTYPNPDGVFGSGDRKQAAWVYRGDQADLGVGASGLVALLKRRRRRDV